MQVRIEHERDGWHFFCDDEALKQGFSTLRSPAYGSYPEVKKQAIAAGHEIYNAGWIHRLLSWNWHSHSFDGYPGWEIEKDNVPAFVKLSHQRGGPDSEVESNEICKAWDDIATGDFYQRDWTEDGIPFCRKGDTYWSGWWFETISERNRFVEWCKANYANAHVVF